MMHWNGVSMEGWVGSSNLLDLGGKRQLHPLVEVGIGVIVALATTSLIPNLMEVRTKMSLIQVHLSPHLLAQDQALLMHLG